MKLAIVRRRFGRAGGAERFIVDIMRALGDRGADVRLISEHFEGPEDLLPRWTKVPQSKGSRTARLRSFERHAREAVEAGGFTVVQTHERMLGADIFRAGDGVHAAWVDRLKRERAWWRRPLLDLDPFHRHLIDMERRMANDSGTLFVAISKLVATELQEWLNLPSHRVRTILNGVDLQHFTPATERQRQAARESFGFNPDVSVAVFAGSGFERKGAFQLLQALALPSSKNMRAIIAGGDRDPSALLRSIRRLGLGGRVRVLGPVADVRPALAAADMFVLPTLYDAMSNAVLEAIASGLPVITTRDAGAADIVRESGAGVIASRHPDDLASAMATVASRHSAMRTAALAYRPRLDLNASAEPWLALYDELT